MSVPVERGAWHATITDKCRLPCMGRTTYGIDDYDDHDRS